LCRSRFHKITRENTGRELPKIGPVCLPGCRASEEGHNATNGSSGRMGTGSRVGITLGQRRRQLGIVSVDVIVEMNLVVFVRNGSPIDDKNWHPLR